MEECSSGTSERAAYRRVGESEHGLRSDPVNCEELSSVRVGPLREQPTGGWGRVSMDCALILSTVRS